jgi:TolB-like protein/Tfp pilus assembly protein PilF
MPDTVSPQQPDRIRTHLAKLLKSGVFAGSERLRRLLKFIVEQNLEFPDQPLKEMVIGSQLYVFDGNFDPRLSAVVRVDATRLRAKLREYYASEGAADSLVIDLPKGRYAPVFREASTKAESDVHGARKETASSIAVLPFSNLSPDPSDYFSDGLTEEIIHALSSVEGISVVARASCFAMKHRNADIREIGRALNVDLVLDGSVRISGNELRATVQLVNTGNGYQVWSRRYDRHLDDLFTVQDDIAREIVNTVRVNTTATPAHLPISRPTNFEAYAWYLRGRHHLSRQTMGCFHRAIECFEQALAGSPEYPAALSGIAAAWLYLGLFAMNRPLEALPKAREAADRALAINELEGEALSVAACTKAMYEWDWVGAETLFRKALDAEPGSEFSKHLFTMFALLPMARIEESLAMVNEAMRIDPLSLFLSSSRTAVLLMARRVGEAEAECRRALELDPDFWRPIVGLGRCYEARGQYEDAIACFERATVVSDRVPSAIGALGRAYALAGRRPDAHKLLQELEELAQRRYVSPYGRVLIYLGLGDEKVFEWLERSSSDRAGWMMYLATDPRFDSLRTDTRFRSILAKLNLPLLANTG